MDKDRDWIPFCALMKAAAETCATQPKNANALGLMFAILSRYSFKQVQRAVARHFASRDGMFWPTPAHIIAQIDGSPDDRAEIAWRELRMAIEKYGPNDSVRFNSPAMHYAIKQMGGWIRVNELFRDFTEKDAEFWGKDFKRLYLIGEKCATWDSEPAYLIGMYERDNSFNGFSDYIPQVVQVSTGKKVGRSSLQSGNKSPVLELVKGIGEDKEAQNG